MQSLYPLRTAVERKDSFEPSRVAYAKALGAGETEASNRVIEELLTRRCSLGEIYSRVITPALVSIGDLWCNKKISVAGEHLATQIVLSHLDRLSSTFAWGDRRSSFRLLVACVEGERHWLGARMFTDLCLSHGWSAEFLGPDVPSDALIDMIDKRAPQVVALSATMAPGAEHARRLVRAIAALPSPPRVVLSGQAVIDRPATSFGAGCVIARDPVEGLEFGLKFLRASRPKAILKEYLLALGRRVRDLRSKKGWTQEQLAEGASVTRGCVVAVEGGKQNVSMDIVVRLANALGVLPESLLMDEGKAVQALRRKQ